MQHSRGQCKAAHLPCSTGTENPVRAVWGKGFKSLFGEGKTLCALIWKRRVSEVPWYHYCIGEVVAIDAKPAKPVLSPAVGNEAVGLCLKNLDLVPHISS